MTFRVPERLRVINGPMASDLRFGNNGLFILPALPGRTQKLRCIASDGAGWEHVSVSLPNRCPSWDEMNYVKDIFWSEDDAVMQLHPPRSDYVNNHPFCLHLWRPIGTSIPLPDSLLVGFVS